LTKKPGDTIHLDYLNLSGVAKSISVVLGTGPAQ